MKKFFTLALMAMATLAANAQGASTSRVWDFRQGFSETTIANLTADAANSAGLWTNNETWFESKGRTSGPLLHLVNGEQVVIPETEGLIFQATSAKHLNVVISHNDGPHIWINGKRNEDRVTIPAVEPGDSVTIIYSSHSGSEARGFKVVTSGVQGTDGNSQWTTVGVADTVVMVNNNAETTDVTIQATNGFHIFYICVGERPTEETQAADVAYFYDSAYPGYSDDNDWMKILMTEYVPGYIPGIRVTPIDIAGDVSLITADSLQGHDVVVIGPYITSANPFAQTLRQALAFTPMLNLSSEIYGAWGVGQAVTSTTNMLTIGARAMESPLFKPIDEGAEPFIDANGQMEMLGEGAAIVGYDTVPGSIFRRDSVLAWAGDVRAIHMHNSDRNAYMLLPYGTADNLAENAGDVLTNAVKMLCATKAKVVKAFAPVVVQDYHHQYTTVSFRSSTDNCSFYYTLDGSDPTTESTLYTGPFDIHEAGVTVKVACVAEGYLLSNVSEQAIEIYELADAPTIAFTEAEGVSTVTITPANEGDVIYYNFIGSDDTASSSVYTEPITLTQHATITAFAGAIGHYLQSETVSMNVTVQGEKVRMDVIGHFDANKNDWCGDGSSNFYVFGKGGYPYYTEEIIGTDEEGYNIYAPANDLRYYAPGNGWELKTMGQPVIWQSLTVAHNVGDPGSYSPASAIDEIDNEITNNCIQFASNSNSNLDGIRDPLSASLQSTTAYQGPFDITIYLGGSGNAQAELYVSTDTLSEDSWQSMGIATTPDIDSNGRNWKRNLLSYEGTDQVYIKVAPLSNTTIRVFDIYVKNEGELSQDYTGISDLAAGNTPSEVVSTMVYGINGARLSAPAKGINIIKEVLANGQVKTRKVIVK